MLLNYKKATVVILGLLFIFVDKPNGQLNYLATAAGSTDLSGAGLQGIPVKLFRNKSERWAKKLKQTGIVGEVRGRETSYRPAHEAAPDLSLKLKQM